MATWTGWSAPDLARQLDDDGSFGRPDGSFRTALAKRKGDSMIGPPTWIGPSAVISQIISVPLRTA